MKDLKAIGMMLSIASVMVGILSAVELWSVYQTTQMELKSDQIKYEHVVSFKK